MAASLTWSTSVSYTSDTTATVKVKLKCKSTYGSYNADAVSGSITIDGTKYSFKHSFSANTTTTLATKSKSVSRTTSSKSVSIKATYATDTSSGTISKSGTVSVSARPKYTVTFDGNGGSSSSTSVYSGYTATFPSSTRTGYTLSNWGASSYMAGSKTPAISAARTFKASWTANNYTITYNANGGTDGTVTSQSRTYNADMLIDTGATPSRKGYNFLGWAMADTATTAQYTSLYPASTSTAEITLYAVWAASYTPPAFDLSKTIAVRYDTATGTTSQDSKAIKINVAWTNGKNADATAAQVTSVKYEYKLSTATSWSTLAMHTGLSGTTDSLIASSVTFDTASSYDIRITLTDENTSVSYTTFVSKASYIWRVPNGGQSLELGVDLIVNDNKDITLTIADSSTGDTDGNIRTALDALGWTADVTE